MDTELAERLMDLKEAVARVDGKCEAIHESQTTLHDTFKTHEDRDREDFREVHSRINKLASRQNWFLGLGTALVFCVGLVMTAAKSFFGV